MVIIKTGMWNNLKAGLINLSGKMTIVTHSRKLIFNALVYLLLCDFAFVFLLPFIYMVTTAVKTSADLTDMYVVWFPKRGIEWNNFIIAFKALVYHVTCRNSIFLSLACSLGHVLSCSLTGYAFARIKFKGRNALFMLMMFSIIVPVQVIIIPLYILHSKIGWLSTYAPIIVPSFLGVGLRGGIYIFIFRQVFQGLPYELEDAARIDGCSTFRTYWTIVLPIAKAAILVTSILSFVWHWNDFYEPSLYIIQVSKYLLPMMLPGLRESTRALDPAENLEKLFNLGVVMAGTFLAVIPVLVTYLFVQRQFMESVERTGIVG